MRGKHSQFFRIFWILFVFALITVLFAVAYYLTNYLYQVTHWNPPAVLAQIINSFLGLILMSLILRIFSGFFRAQQFGAFTPVIDALERIAKGDFSTRLDNDLDDGILSNLVVSVNKMALELGQMENMRQEFISNVSHEIQSPLTSIRGFAQALQDEQLSIEERRHYLSIIETESTRLSRLADDLLKLASLESDQVQFAPKPYRLDKQIRSLILTCEPQWRDKAIEMDVALDEISISADEDLLSQVWLNLIHNGIKFTPQGGSIKVTLQVNGDRVRFRISDSGIGISVEDQIHIFERFYKADKSRTRSKEGSGLGLSIVKKIVDIHRGEIDVESKVGEGTTFIVSLPME
ncbi:MAG: HAMP domain-containing sensor histidine kinase [Anaerolineales bacterium]